MIALAMNRTVALSNLTVLSSFPPDTVSDSFAELRLWFLKVVEDLNLKTVALLLLLFLYIFCIYKKFHGHLGRGRIPSLAEGRACIRLRDLRRKPRLERASSTSQEN